MNETTRIFLKQKEDKEIQQGYPWVYDNEISFVKEFAQDKSGIKQVQYEECITKDGSLVDLYTKAGGFLGCGVLNKKSKIAIRLISNKVHADKVLDDTKKFWDEKIRNAYNIRKLNYNEEDSYRLVFAEADFVPGFICDRYVEKSGKVYLVVQFLALTCEIFRKEIIDSLIEVCKPFAIYEKSNTEVMAKEGLEEKTGFIYKSGEKIINIIENGVELEVDIADGQKTGYFLDQKFNRSRAASFCHGKKVLDTFTHTGAFGLNAAKAGAREVISVDISQDAVSLVNKNIKLNGVEDKMQAVCADVFDLLKQYEEEGQKFDVIILDPPAFTKSGKTIEKAYGGYKEINLRAMRLLNAGGILVTCSCSYYFDENMFYSMLMHAAMNSHRKVQILEKRGAGPDHPVLLGYPKSEYLKCAICRVI